MPWIQSNKLAFVHLGASCLSVVSPFGRCDRAMFFVSRCIFEVVTHCDSFVKRT